MKYEGKYKGIPVYSNPAVESGMLYLINEDNFITNYPTKKNGTPDMRFSINKMQAIFDENHKFRALA